MKQQLRRAARAVRNLAIGPDEVPIMSQMIRRDARTPTFFAALDYINYERVPGDVVEFGVYTGIALALFAQGHAFDPKGMDQGLVFIYEAG
jgi:hypothetical protein